MNLILCGLPRSGKTTIGKILAEKLKWAFIDTDQLIQSAFGKSCREIYASLGEKGFRELEKEQIARLHGMTNSVISLGGGSLNDPENRKRVQAAGTLVYLKGEERALFKRFKHMPAYLDRNDPLKSYLDLASKRKPLYEEAAHLIIETSGLEKHEIAAAILEEFTYGK